MSIQAMEKFEERFNIRFNIVINMALIQISFNGVRFGRGFTVYIIFFMQSIISRQRIVVNDDKLQQNLIVKLYMQSLLI